MQCDIYQWSDRHLVFLHTDEDRYIVEIFVTLLPDVYYILHLTSFNYFCIQVNVIILCVRSSEHRTNLFLEWVHV